MRTNDLLDKKTLDLCSDLEKLVMYSVTKQTWSRHCSAWKLFDEFCAIYAIANTLPVKIETARAFTTWAVSRRGLKGDTVKAYLSSLNVAHSISNTSSANFNSDPCIKIALKGAKNLEGLSKKGTSTRLPMNIHLLNILGHRIMESNWSDFSKQVFWTACVTSFYTSCRMGEILPERENYVDPHTTLSWQNVQFGEDDEILIFVPYSKTSGFDGKLLDVYPIKDSNTCPAAALKRLRTLAIKVGTFAPENPVFAFKSKKNLTKAVLNKKLAELLGDFCDCNHKFTGHTFRAAIPSLLGSFPDQNSVSELKEWGNWGSDSYKHYMKDVRENRRKIFSKIIDCMYDNSV